MIVIIRRIAILLLLVLLLMLVLWHPDQTRHKNVLCFEGVCVNYRNPDPRRGEPRVGSAPDVAFPVDPLLGSAELREAQKLLVFTCFSAHLAGIDDLFLYKICPNLVFHKKSKIHRFLIDFFFLGEIPESRAYAQPWT